MSLSDGEFRLENFLAEQSSQGTEKAEGEFTIDKGKAAEKLARFALPCEYSWVLKLVQAAVMWQAESIQVAQSRLYTQIRFAFEEPPSVESVIKQVLALEVGGESPLATLAIALRSLVEQAGLSFVLGLRRDELQTVYAGDDFSQLNKEARRELGEMPVQGIHLTVSHLKGAEHHTGRYIPRFANVPRRDVDIRRILVDNAFCSPVPIVIDGRPLGPLLESPELGFNKTHRPLVVHRVESSDSPPLRFSGPLSEGVFPCLEFPGRILRGQITSPSSAAWCVWRLPDMYKEPEESNSPSSVLWVKHGVVVQRQRLRDPLKTSRLTILLSAEGLHTDLTGFQLGDQTERTGRLGAVLLLLQEFFRQENSHEMLDFSPCVPEDHSLKSSLIKGMRHTAYLTPLLKINPIFGAGAIAGAAFLNLTRWKFPARTIAGLSAELIRERFVNEVRDFRAAQPEEMVPLD